jgi:hypothetical protein
MEVAASKTLCMQAAADHQEVARMWHLLRDGRLLDSQSDHLTLQVALHNSVARVWTLCEVLVHPVPSGRVEARGVIRSFSSGVLLPLSAGLQVRGQRTPAVCCSSGVCVVHDYLLDDVQLETYNEVLEARKELNLRWPAQHTTRIFSPSPYQQPHSHV